MYTGGPYCRVVRLHEHEISILKALRRQRSASPDSLEKSLGIGKDSVIWALENLASNGFVRIEREKSETVSITEEGKSYMKRFPEEELVIELGRASGQMPIGKLKGMKNFEIALMWAKSNDWARIDGGELKLTHKGRQIAEANAEYDARKALERLASGIQESGPAIETLRKRNLVGVSYRSAIKSVHITAAGEKAPLEGSVGIGALTREIIAGRQWERERIRPYDINASVDHSYPARQHPVREFIDAVRSSFFNMGFKEVSGPIIESAFWNFDALFSPQDHPTREMQDTFFLKNPKQLTIDDLALMKRVREMHVDNWKEEWSDELAKQALLRTHTTSVSARHIKRFASASGEYPLKLFSIGKVFRNESIDYKHLAELHQCDGIIIGNGLTLANLIHTLKEFYLQIGIDEIIIKPSYFPFVEPGLEVHYYDKKRKDMIELCGGGIIRKEITRAMGTQKTVLAWGMGLERLMFNFMEFQSLADLYKNEMGWLRNRGELKV